ncbi:MAG TPA: siphovirus Gp157 family protein [Nannocystis sp.]
MTTATISADRTLWQIGDDLEALAALLEEMGGDVSEEEAEAAIDAWLAETREAEATKLDRYKALMDALEERAVAREAKAQWHREQAAANEAVATAERNKIQRLKDRLIAYMDRTGRTALHGHVSRFTLRNNGGKPPLVTDPVDPWAVEPRFRRATLVLTAPADETLEALRSQCRKLDLALDNDAIRAALDAGEVVPFARYGERGRHVVVK